MSAEEIKPMASLGAGLLGRRSPGRRVPLTFAPIEELTRDATIDADLPEVMLQVARLAQALGIDVPADVIDAQDPATAPARPRVAFTFRLDPARHARLRQLASLQARSAQSVLIDALDRYSAGAPGAATSPATPRQTPTGNQP